MMSDPASGLLGIVAAKLGGSVAGTFLSLTFMPPKSWRDGLSRGFISLVTGFIFAPVVRDYFNWSPTLDRRAAAACLAAFPAWWGMGLIVRLASGGKTPPLPRKGPETSKWRKPL
jgi:Family of unknown function (DUF6107)